MLAGEKRRRHHHGHLLAGIGRHEGRPQRHLGLAEAHVAADEAVHGPPALQVVQHGLDGAELVVGFLVGEAGAELVEGAFRRGEDVTRLQFARCRRLDQVVGNLADAFLEARLLRLPGAATQTVKLHAFRLGTVAREEIDVLDRNEESVVVVIDQQQAVVRRALHLDGAKALEAADAVVDVDHVVARSERGEFGDDIRRLAGPAGAAHHAVAQNVLLGNDGDVVRLEAFFEGQHHDVDQRGRTARHISPGLGIGDGLHLVVAQDGGETFRRTFRPCGQHHALARLAQRLDVGLHGLIDIAARFRALCRKAPAPAAAEGDGIALGPFEGGDLHHRAISEKLLPFFRHHEEPRRRQRLVGRGTEALLGQRFLAGVIVFGNLLVPGGCGFQRRVAESDHRFGHEISEP